MTNLPTRTIGQSDLATPAIGLGCMSLSGVYGAADDAQSLKLLHHAVDAGVTMLDSADMYGWGHNEELLQPFLAERRDEVLLATKFGQVLRDGQQGVDGSPDYVQEACETSLKRLGVEVIDLYYQHRVDPNVPIEDTVGAMARLVEQGKVRHLALSEARPDTIRRAHATHPIAAVQSEYSLLYREVAEETRATTTELGISFVAYAPLGRSLLTGTVTAGEALPEDDRRAQQPRFAEGHREKNLAMVETLKAVAADNGCTPGQAAVAWVLAQGEDVLAIPGTKRIERFDENLGALSVSLGADDLARLDAAFPPGAGQGERYPAQAMKAVYR